MLLYATVNVTSCYCLSATVSVIVRYCLLQLMLLYVSVCLLQLMLLYVTLSATVNITLCYCLSATVNVTFCYGLSVTVNVTLCYCLSATLNPLQYTDRYFTNRNLRTDRPNKVFIFAFVYFARISSISQSLSSSPLFAVLITFINHLRISKTNTKTSTAG
jgi:hypothetical protein